MGEVGVATIKINFLVLKNAVCYCTGTKKILSLRNGYHQASFVSSSCGGVKTTKLNLFPVFTRTGGGRGHNNRLDLFHIPSKVIIVLFIRQKKHQIRKLCVQVVRISSGFRTKAVTCGVKITYTDNIVDTPVASIKGKRD